jgi:hypothetical protein
MKEYEGCFLTSKSSEVKTNKRFYYKEMEIQIYSFNKFYEQIKTSFRSNTEAQIAKACKTAKEESFSIYGSVSVFRGMSVPICAHIPPAWCTCHHLTLSRKHSATSNLKISVFSLKVSTM